MGGLLHGFLRPFLSLRIKAKIKEFVNLKQERMSIQEYALKFHQLSRYAPEMVSSMRARIHKFVSRLSCELVLEIR